MILDFKDGFCIRLGADPSVDVSPMEPRFEEEERLAAHLIAVTARLHEEELR